MSAADQSPDLADIYGNSLETKLFSAEEQALLRGVLDLVHTAGLHVQVASPTAEYFAESHEKPYESIELLVRIPPTQTLLPVEYENARLARHELIRGIVEKTGYYSTIPLRFEDIPSLASLGEIETSIRTSRGYIYGIVADHHLKFQKDSASIELYLEEDPAAHEPQPQLQPANS